LDVLSHPEESMIKLAVYGKGGIGKSTISANLSAALAGRGVKVLQIGCDPKHDSTRLLMGEVQGTVLDYLRRTDPEDRCLTDVLGNGSGVLCVEAGGPEPGVGCAGRGIISTFELLRELGIDDLEVDVVIYDVLGDVVCGGFAVPLRREYADRVAVVTSGEFMSIYAANNILRGVRNFDGEGRRMAGLILNSRGDDVENRRVEAFAEAVGLPILERMPRSDLFLHAEREGRTVVREFPDSDIAMKFDSLARTLASDLELHPARPLDDADLESLVLGKRKEREEVPSPTSEGRGGMVAKRRYSRYLSRSTSRREPLYGCAFAGAMNTAIQMAGAEVVVHGPLSCAHIAHQSIASAGRRRLRRTGVADRHLALGRDVTGIGERSLIFGGEGELESTLRRRLESGSDHVIVLTTCPTGIIGDDVRKVTDGLSNEFPGAVIIPVLTDGNLTGDFVQGIIDLSMEVGKVLIDRDVVPEGRRINIVGEKTLAGNTEDNIAELRKVLDDLGIDINCRFICNTSVAEIRSFNRAGISTLAHLDQFALCLKGFLEEGYGTRFTSTPLPIGFTATAAWLRQLGAHFGIAAETEETIARWECAYQKEIEALRPRLEGRKVAIMSLVRSVDWVLEAVTDLGMEVVKVGIVDRSDHLNDTSVRSGYAEVEYDYSPERWAKDIEALGPDLALSNYVSPLEVRQDSIPLCPPAGFLSGVRFGERWSRVLRAPMVEGWRADGS
jgi:nitrogenase iron protein NifH